MIYIIDAYNVIHKIKKLEVTLNQNLRRARDALVELCGRLVCARGGISKIILVFDGKSEFRDLQNASPPKIELVFSETGESADERIILVLEQLEKQRNKCVVSDDNFVRNHARAYAASVMSVSQFTPLIYPSNQKQPNKRSPHDSARGLSPEEARDITEAYKKHLGLS